ncbi:MAG: hypothetical protein RR808_09630, partial [Akkermansia sp.]
YTAGTLGVNVDYTLTANRFSNFNSSAFTAITLASASGKTLTLDSGMAAKTITKTGEGTLKLATESTTANVILQAGVLDMSNALAHATVTVAESSTASLKGADKLKDTSNINLTDGTLRTSGYVGGTINIAGTSTLTQDANGNYRELNLTSGANLTYNMGETPSILRIGEPNTLSVGALQTVRVANGASALNSNLTIGGGGILSFTEVTAGSTASLALNSHNLTFTKGAIIDLDGWEPITGTDSYTFNLISGISNSDLASLGTGNITLAQSSSITGSAEWVLNNGTLSLQIEMIASLVWNGTQDDSTWVMGSTNWTKKGSTSEPIYSDNEYVLFNDTAAIKTVTLAGGTYNPLGLTVTTADSYTFKGAGSIAMTGDKAYLTKNGEGSLILNNGANSATHIAINAGSIDINGTSSLSGNLELKANSSLTHNSTASSSFTNVKGADSSAITINKGNVNLSSATLGDYKGTVTLTQGHLTNDKTLGNGSLTIAASGKVTMDGVTNAQLKTLGTTSTTGNIQWSATGGITLTGDTTFTLDGTNAALTFTGAGANGSFDLTGGKLILDLGDTYFKDSKNSYAVNVIDSGSFGSYLGTANEHGNYSNIALAGADNVFYYVTDVNNKNGSVILTQRGRFELTANNKSTPNITVENSQKVAVVSGADKFKYEDEAGTPTDFKNVVVNGDLYLASNDGDTNKTYNVNNLSGTNAGASLIIGGSKGATLNLHNAGEMNTNFAGSIIGKTDSTISKTGKGTLTVNGGISSTGTLEIKNGILSTTQVAIKGVSISDKGTLNLTGTGDQAVSNMGELSINDGTINLGDGTYFYTLNVMGYMFFKNATFAGKGEICQSAGNKMDVFGTNNLSNTVKIKQEENSTLNLGTATVTTIGGLIGKGIVTATIDTSLTINTPLGDGEIYNYEGFLSGPNIVAGTVVGIIIKEGEGSQALSGTTDANNLYNLAVKEGNLILNSDKAIYAAITVQGEIKAGRAFTLANENATANANANANAIDPALKSGTLSIFKSTTGASLTVKNNGIVNVAQGQTLTLTGTSTFE